MSSKLSKEDEPEGDLDIDSFFLPGGILDPSSNRITNIVNNMAKASYVSDISPSLKSSLPANPWIQDNSAENTWECDRGMSSTVEERITPQSWSPSTKSRQQVIELPPPGLTVPQPPPGFACASELKVALASKSDADLRFASTAGSWLQLQQSTDGEQRSAHVDTEVVDALQNSDTANTKVASQESTCYSNASQNSCAENDSAYLKAAFVEVHTDRGEHALHCPTAENKNIDGLDKSEEQSIADESGGKDVFVVSDKPIELMTVEMHYKKTDAANLDHAVRLKSQSAKRRKKKYATTLQTGADREKAGKKQVLEQAKDVALDRCSTKVTSPSLQDRRPSPRVLRGSYWQSLSFVFVSPLSVICHWLAELYAMIGPVFWQACSMVLLFIFNSTKYISILFLAIMNIARFSMEEISIFHYLYGLVNHKTSSRHVHECASSLTTISCYAVLYMTPILCDYVMDHADLAHYTPHIVSNFFLYLLSHYLLRSCNKPPSLLSRRGRVLQSLSNGATCMNAHSTRILAAEQDRLKMEHLLCQRILRSMRFAIPFAFLADGFSESNAGFALLDSSVRLVVAYVLSTTKAGYLLSPITWIGWSIQVISVSYFPSGHILDAFLFLLGTSVIRLIDKLIAL